MEKSEEVQALSRIREANRKRQRTRLKALASVRVSPGAYLAVASIMTFASVLLLRAQNEGWALIALAAGWLIAPALALTDRVVFDGETLSRRGFIPSLIRIFKGRFRELSVGDIEKVDTNAVRTLRRGGSVRYRYRTQVNGKGQSFVFASGGRSYRKMVRQL